MEKTKIVEYYVRWRHIPSYAKFTPLMYLSVDHSVITTKTDANEHEIILSLLENFKILNLKYEDIRIEDFTEYKTVDNQLNK